MTITLTPEIEQALTEQAHRQGTTPENLALNALREKYSLPAVQSARISHLEPRDEWERLILGIGIDCGVSLSNEDLSRENLYD